MKPALRNEMMRLGILMKCASAGVKPQQVQSVPVLRELLTKKAEGALESTLDTGVKSLALVSALVGVPVGALWHLVNNRADESNLKADNTLAQANIYRNAATDIERALGKSVRTADSVSNYEEKSRNPYRLETAQ